MTVTFGRWFLRSSIPCLFMLTIDGAAVAQDTHYWNLQYGTRGELLSGVVVGSAVDMSATYYNPGSLSLVDDKSFILTASVFQVQTIQVTNSDENADAIASRTVGPAPGLIAGILPLGWFGDTWGYSFLTRQKLDFRLDSRDGMMVGLDEPGDTLSIGGEISLDQGLTENWGGATWSTLAGHRLGLGVTLYGAYRSQRTRREQTIEAIGNNDYGAMLFSVGEVDYQTFRLLAKLGASADFAGSSFGVTVTTPGLAVFGTGQVAANTSQVGDVDGNGTDDSTADVSFGTDLPAEYRSPLSVAIGGSRQMSSYTIHATVEWFSSIDPYTVVESPAPNAGPGVTSFDMTYVHALKSVWNFGFGFEKHFSDRGTAYASFITDYSAWEDLSQQQIVLTSWDLYQINGGVALEIKGIDLTLGGGFTWGSRPVDIEVASTGVLPPTVTPTDMTYRRIKMLIGFAL